MLSAQGLVTRSYSCNTAMPRAKVSLNLRGKNRPRLEANIEPVHYRQTNRHTDKVDGLSKGQTDVSTEPT